MTLTLYVIGKTYQKHVQPERTLHPQGDTLILWYALWNREDIIWHDTAGKAKRTPPLAFVSVARLDVEKPEDVAVAVSHEVVP